MWNMYKKVKAPCRSPKYGIVGPHVSDTLVIAPSNFSLCVIIHL